MPKLQASGQNLDYMFKLNIQTLLLGYTSHVHQARAVRASDIFGARLDVALHLVLTHLCRDGCLLDREHTTEAAALIRTLRLYNVDAVYQLQQVLNLIELVDVFLAGT